MTETLNDWGILKTIHPCNGTVNIMSAERLSYIVQSRRKIYGYCNRETLYKQEAAVIRGDQTEEESTLVNEITRNGYFLPVYLGDRLTGPLFNFNGTVEDAMHFMLNRMETVPHLLIGTGTGDTKKVQFQATYKNVLEYHTKLARFAEIGFRIVPDFKKKTMTFENL